MICFYYTNLQIDAGTVTYTYDNADAFQQPHVDRPRQNSFFQGNYFQDWSFL